MKIGIVSDSHGKSDRLARALDLLIQRGAETIVHCGDIGDDHSMRTLGQTGVPAYAVSGNTDRYMPYLAEVAASAGVEFHWEVIAVPLGDGRHLVATHGHDPQLVNELLAGQQFPYLCLGHSHLIRDQRSGLTRIINPGALHRATPHTAALLDTDTDGLEFIEIADE